MNQLQKALLEVNLLKERLVKAIANAEAETFGQKDVVNNTSITDQKSNDLRTKVFSQEYATRFQMILRKADKIVENSTPEQLMALAEKHGISEMYKDLNEEQTREYIKEMKEIDAKFGLTSDDIGEFDEYMGMVNPSINKMSVNNTLKMKRDELIYNFTDKSDPQYNEIELSFTNEVEDLQFDELIDEAQLKNRSKSFKIYGHSNSVQYRLESYADVVHIKKVDSTIKLLEFYVNKKSIYLDNFVSKDFIDWKQFSVKDKYGDQYSFDKNSFHKISETQSFYVIKFFATQLKIQKQNSLIF